MWCDAIFSTSNDSTNHTSHIRAIRVILWTLSLAISFRTFAARSADQPENMPPPGRCVWFLRPHPNWITSVRPVANRSQCPHCTPLTKSTIHFFFVFGLSVRFSPMQLHCGVDVRTRTTLPINTQHMCVCVIVGVCRPVCLLLACEYVCVGSSVPGSWTLQLPMSFGSASVHKQGTQKKIQTGQRDGQPANRPAKKRIAHVHPHNLAKILDRNRHTAAANRAPRERESASNFNRSRNCLCSGLGQQMG